MNRKITIGIMVTAIALTSIVAFAQTSPSLTATEFALRQQMIDFAKYFPNLVHQYYPDVPKDAGSPILGAVAGPDIMSPYFSFGGKRQWAYKAFPTATSTGYQSSTTCSIPAPFATSTVFTSYAFTVLASTTVLETGWSLGPMATSTLLAASSSVTGGNPLPVLSSSTAQIFGSNFKTFIVPPSIRDANGQPQGSFINFKLGSGAVGAFPYPQGYCSAIFTETQ